MRRRKSAGRGQQKVEVEEEVRNLGYAVGVEEV
jgi:hypothetical protein